MQQAACASALAACILVAPNARAIDASPALDLLSVQSLTILQTKPSMRSPYAGPNSLPGERETRTSESLLLSLGKTLRPGLQAYADGRILRGGGLGNENGLGGYANGDFTATARASGVYLLRAYLRGFVALGEKTEQADEDANPLRIVAAEPTDRIEWKVGRILPTDDFDELRYAGTPARQFVNLGLVNNPAWDNAQTGRGYTEGLFVGLVRERYEVRLGTYRMPRSPNGPTLDGNVRRSRSDNFEVTLQPQGSKGPVVRALLFRNVARMGNYRDAVALADGGTPDLGADERPGRTKRGATLNAELPFADDGETGLFACWGWNDGRNEDFSFTEVDRNVCGGAQIAGARWGREDDRIGIAYLASGLSRSHRDYLAAGGSGFQLGDGTLSYGGERVFEAYYRFVAMRGVEISPDFQYVARPGFNRDRGPARIVSLRLRLVF